MTLSPHELQPVGTWFKTFPKKCVDRFPTYLWPLGTIGFVMAVIEWSDAKDHEEDYAHRF